MDRVLNLTDVVKREVAEYAWDEPDSKAYFMENEARRAYGVVVVPTGKPQKTLTILFAHISENETVVIDTDLGDKPLFDALIQAGIPRSQIIRAYRGETTPAH